jgi:hypothetical protein
VFYSVHGWASSAVTGSLLIYWIIAASVVLFFSGRTVVDRSMD